MAAVNLPCLEQLYLTGGKAFDVITSQLSIEKKVEFLAGAVTVSDAEAIRFATLIRSGQLMPGIDQFPNQALEDTALKALLLGKIFFAEYASFHFTRGCMVGEATVSSTRSESFFDSNGLYASSAASLIRQTSLPEDKSSGGFGSLTPEKEARLVEFMRQVPPSEQRFRIALNTCSNYGAHPRLILTQVQRAGLNIFYKLENGEIMVPSFSLQQAYVYALYPEGTEVKKILTMTPVFGSAENRCRNTRMYQLFSSRVPTPQLADGFCSGPLEGLKTAGSVIPYSDFSRHNLYQAVVAAGLRGELGEMVAFLAEELSNHRDNSYINMIYNMVTSLEVYGKVGHGMEMVRKGKKVFKSCEQAFWSGFCHVMDSVFNTASLRERELYRQATIFEELSEEVVFDLKQLETENPFKENRQDLALLSHLLGVIPKIAEMFTGKESEWNKRGIYLENFAYSRERVKTSFPQNFNPLIYLENHFTDFQQGSGSESVSDSDALD